MLNDVTYLNKKLAFWPLLITDAPAVWQHSSKVGSCPLEWVFTDCKFLKRCPQNLAKVYHKFDIVVRIR